jgi:hypothetical protein
MALPAILLAAKVRIQSGLLGFLTTTKEGNADWAE